MPNSGKLSVAWLYDDSLDTNDGVAQYVKTLGAWMTEQGHDVTYLVGETKIDSWHGAPVHTLSKNVRVRWGGNRLTIPLRPKATLIKGILSENRFDVVHVTVPYSPLMSQRVINSLPDETALVGTWHIYPARKSASVGGKALKLSYGRSLKRFDDFISVSSAAADYAKSVFSVDSKIIPNPVKLPTHNGSHVIPGRIVFLGRMVKRKGVEYLIKVFAELSKNRPEVELVLGGDGPLRGELESLAQQLGIKEKVEFLGFVDEADKYRLLSTAQIACFPSLYGESFGIVLVEAMAAGAKVVVGGDNPGYRTVLGKRPELLVDPKDVVSFARSLEKLIGDDKLSDELNEWQQSQIRNYDVEAIGPRIIELYRQTIAKRQSSRHN
jgi:phosphatidylinositol alpha-mannosyltransferase